ASWRDYGAPPQSSPAPRSDVPSLSTGDSVRHNTLGEGVVTRLEPDGVVVVRFADDGSERRLVLEYAPLEKLQACPATHPQGSAARNASAARTQGARLACLFGRPRTPQRAACHTPEPPTD